MMNVTHRGAHPRTLDEVAIAALAAGLHADDTLVDFELVELDPSEDLDVTARFVRESSPYDRIAITELAENAPEWRATSWKWFAYSGAAWALALAIWWIGRA